MSEQLPNDQEFQDGQPLDRGHIIGRLQEFGIGIEHEDLDDLDDNDVMGVILTYAAMYDFDIDEVLKETIPVENRTRGEEGEPYSDEI